MSGPAAQSAVVRAAVRVVAALGLVLFLSQPLTAIASSGWREDAHCCCPDPQACNCPAGDHGNGTDMLRRCGGAGTLMTPAVQIAVVPPAPIDRIIAPAPQAAPAPAAEIEPDERWYEPETPPF
jgi:hypothetical protein